MIKLTKPIKREIFLRESEGRYRGNTILLELQPGDTIEFRIKGTRQRVSISLAHCYNLAKKLSAEHTYKAKLKSYQEKKKVGERAKAPKRPYIPFNPKLY